MRSYRDEEKLPQWVKELLRGLRFAHGKLSREMSSVQDERDAIKAVLMQAGGETYACEDLGIALEEIVEVFHKRHASDREKDSWDIIYRNGQRRSFTHSEEMYRAWLAYRRRNSVG